MDDDGITNDPEKRVAIAERIIEEQLKRVLKLKILWLILAMAVSAEPTPALITQEPSGWCTRNCPILLRCKYVSFGLPDRNHLIHLSWHYLSIVV
jgi:5-methyltetrahydrofolate--homocysteine methyltransferase